MWKRLFSLEISHLSQSRRVRKAAGLSCQKSSCSHTLSRFPKRSNRTSWHRDTSAFWEGVAKDSTSSHCSRVKWMVASDLDAASTAEGTSYLSAVMSTSTRDRNVEA